VGRTYDSRIRRIRLDSGTVDHTRTSAQCTFHRHIGTHPQNSLCPQAHSLLLHNAYSKQQQRHFATRSNNNRAAVKYYNYRASGFIYISQLLCDRPYAYAINSVSCEFNEAQYCVRTYLFHDCNRRWVLPENGCDTQTQATFRSSRLSV